MKESQFSVKEEPWGSRQSRPIEIKIDFFFSWSRFLKSRFFNQDLSLSRYLSRQIKTVEIFEIYQDISTLSRLFEVLQDQKSSQIEKSRSRNVIKLTNSRSRLRQTVKICQKCHVLTDFSVSVKTFGTGRWCRDKIEISQSRSSRLTFWNCRDFLNCWDWLFPCRDKSRHPGL